jgi:hypothetical protein
MDDPLVPDFARHHRDLRLGTPHDCALHFERFELELLRAQEKRAA